MNIKINSSNSLNQYNFQHSKLSIDTLINSNSVIPPLSQRIYKESNKKVNNTELTFNQHNDSIENFPVFLKIAKINSSLITSYKNILRTSTKHDNNCYIVKEQYVSNHKELIIVEKNVVTKHIEKDFSVNITQRANGDWTFIPILIGLILLASIVTNYRKYLGLLFESIIYRFTSNKILNEKNIQFQKLTFMLDVLFILSLALIVDEIVKYFGIYEPPEKFKYIVFVVFVIFLIVLRLFRLIVFNLSAVFSNHQVFFRDLIKNSSLYTRTLGMFLLPMVFLITYSTGFITSIFIYISIIVILIMLILRIISILKGFIVGGFSIFYFILYLCALEIVPLLIIWKEVKSR